MKNLSRFIFVFVVLQGLILSARAQDPSPGTVTKSEADLAHEAVWAIYKEEPPSPKLLKENPREYYRWTGEKFRRFADAAQTFSAKYPNDPRRWEAIVQSSY